MNTTAPSRWRRPTLALTALVAVLAGMGGPVAPPAQAGQGTGDPVLEVSVTSAAADRVTDITVTGRDYLVPPHAPGTAVFGGVYVFFGWVSDPGGFGPSIRNSSNDAGTYGVTYAYPGDGADPGTRDPGTGTMRLVAFTPGGESGEATEFHMDRDGNWSTRMRLYGSRFTYLYPPTGEERTVDCQEVRCGVFTIGAHGKASATNERFVPIRFTGAAAPVTIPPSTPSTAPPTAPTTGAPTVAADGGGAVPPGPAGTEATPPVEEGRPASPPTSGGPGDADPDEPVVLGVSEVRSTGSSTGPVVAGVVVAGLVAAVALGRAARRRKRSAPTSGGT